MFSIEPIRGVNVLSIKPMWGIHARGVRGSAISRLIESLDMSGFEKVYSLFGVLSVRGNICNCTARSSQINN